MLLIWSDAPAQDGVGERRIRFHTYSATDGLSQATARAIVQDRDGFVWIGTQDGLNRFDGYDFRVFRHDRTEPWTLSQNHVWCLLADPDGSLWVGTQAGGLNRYDPAQDRFSRYAGDKTGTIESRLVTALLRDDSGRIWVGNGGGKLQWVDRAHERLVDTPLGERASLRMVRALLQASDGSVWVGTYQGLFRTDKRARELTEVRAGEAQPLDVYALAQTQNGELWVGTAESGLYRLDAAGQLLAHHRRGPNATSDLPDNEVRSLLAGGDGRLWIGTNTQGIVMLDPQRSGFTHLQRDASRADTLAANRIHALFEDRNGLLFAGSWTNGFSVHDPRTQAFGLIDRVADGTDQRTVASSSVFADADGTLWAAIASGGGLVHFDLSGRMLSHYGHDAARADSLAHDFVQYVTRTRDGSLWVGTMGGGLDRLKPDGQGFEHLRHDAADSASVASDNITFIADDSAGTLWVGTLDAGLDERCARCSGFSHHRHYPADPTSAAGETVSAVRELRNGEFWVAYRTEGLDRLDRASGKFEHFRANPADAASPSSDAASVLAEDARGDLWVGTQGGGLMHRLGGKGPARFETIDTRDGLGADAIGAIVETAPGTFWVSTTTGLSRIDRAADGARQIVNYDAHTGAQPRGYWVNAASRLPDGRIAFGGLDGISVLDPLAVKPVPKAHPLVTAVLLSNRRVAPRWREPQSPLDASVSHGGKVELEHRQDNVTFEFSALDYSDPDAVRYEYRLEGHDEQWIETAAARRVATYTDLAAGRYRLLLRVRQQAADWIDAPNSVEIRVLPPPWASPRAYALYAAATVLALILVALIARTVLRRRSAVQQAIQHSAERLKLALWGSGSELWDVDLRSGRMVRENRLAHLAANTEAAEQTMTAYAPFIHPDDIEAFLSAFRAHVRGETVAFECSYRTLDTGHNWIWILTRGRAQRDAAGRALRISGTNHDIENLKATEEALRTLNEQLESRVEQRTTDLRDANLKLRGTLDILTLTQRQLIETEKLASLGGMVAGIAHEINTPLGISVTAASHLQDEARRMSRLIAQGELTHGALERFEHAARESTDIVLRNLQRADALVKSFKQVAVDQSSEDRRTVDLGKSLGEIVTTLGPTLKSSGCHIDLHCPQLIIIETAPGALYQIVTNLVMNSLTHGFEKGTPGGPSRPSMASGALGLLPGDPSRPSMASGALELLPGDPSRPSMASGALGLLPGAIRIEVRRDDAAVRIDYRDNGRGMDEVVRKRIFEPFFTTRRGQGGSGLGMHIVYNLVTQVLQGTIECVSTPGEGVVFHIVLPVPPSA